MKALARSAGWVVLAVMGVTVSQAQVAVPGAGTGGADQASFTPTAGFRSQTGYAEVHAGLAHSDNVTLVPADKVQDTIGSVGLGVDYACATGALSLDARGVLDWNQYFHHTYNGTAYGSLNGTAIAGTRDSPFQWTLQDTFSQLNSNPLAAATPNNVENVNYLTTGPTLNLAFGTASRLSLYGLYSDTSYQKSPFDSHRVTGGFSLSDALSAASRVALNGSTSHTVFQNEAVSGLPYDQRSLYLSYNAAGQRTRLELDGGYNDLRRNGLTSGGPLIGLQLDRRISYESSVFVRARSQYSSTMDSLRADLGGTGLSTPGLSSAFPGTATPDVYKDESGALGWNLTGVRTTLSLLASLDRQRYSAQTSLDGRVTTYEATIARKLTPATSLTLDARRWSDHYENISADIAETVFTLGVSHTLDRLSLSGDYVWHRRSTSGNSPFLNDFDENRIEVRVSYYLTKAP
jgi:hypothetical protein